MSYNDFLDKYKNEIDNLDFVKVLKTIGYSSFEWKKLITDLIKLGIDPLAGLEVIPKSYFQGLGIESLDIPDSVIGIIGDYAFASCINLERVTIPDSVTDIGMYAFDSCTSLKSVIIGNGVESIGYRAFMDCRSLIDLTMGNKVKIIDVQAFCLCPLLTSIKFNGTKAQWGSIDIKARENGFNVKKIICKDGNISL